jgi:Flp pilus assembly protein TadD
MLSSILQQSAKLLVMHKNQEKQLEKVRTAIMALQFGQAEKSERILKAVLRGAPRQFDALLVLGTLYGQQGRFAEAVPILERATRARTDNADAHFNLGLALANLGEPDRAVECYRTALKTDSRHLDSIINLGGQLLALNRWDDAITCLERGLILHPQDTRLLNNLGIALIETNQLTAAIETFKRAIDSAPSDPEAYSSLGLALSQADRLQDAATTLRKGLSYSQTSPKLHNAIGIVLCDLGQFEEGIQHIRRAIELDPEVADYHRNLGMMLLLRQDFREGWREYRFDEKHRRAKANRPAIDAPYWQGELLAGKSIFISCEQGLGDSIQFVRYLPLLLDMKANVTLEVPPSLIPLFAQFEPPVRIVVKDCFQDRVDFQSSLASLPRWFETDLSNIPHKVPYLSVDSALVAEWRERIGSSGFKVGLCWQGNPEFRRDKARSIPLSEFAPLAELPGVRLISLQKNFGVEQISTVPFEDRIEVLGEDYHAPSSTFCDTAAIMLNMDLIVSSDTSVAHLAGALARPLYVALSRYPDWRWFLDRDDSPWYPTARLFRQRNSGEWADVFSRIATAVNATANN